MNDIFDSTQLPTPIAEPVDTGTDTGTDPDTGDDTSEAVTRPTKRAKVRWYHVAVLGVAVLACAAAVGFSTSEASSRDEATSKRVAAQVQLRAQRRDTEHAATGLVTERDETRVTLEDVAQITTSLHEFSDLVAQEVDALAAAQQLRVNAPDAVDEYNALVDHGNDLLHQIQAKAEAIVAQAEALRDKADAQLAVATSSG